MEESRAYLVELNLSKRTLRCYEINGSERKEVHSQSFYKRRLPPTNYLKTLILGHDPRARLYADGEVWYHGALLSQRFYSRDYTSASTP